jgi:transcriptional regulator with XRE-family HTH domain
MADSHTGRTLAQKLTHLFETVHGPRGPYSLGEVVKAIADSGGPTISKSHLAQLKNGERDNPTLRTLQAIADFFGVPVAYFSDDAVAEQIDAQLRLLASLRDTGVRNIAARLAGLSPGSIDLVGDMVDRLRELEGLPDEEQAAPEQESP